MKLWRVTRAPHQALDGEGARLYGGRWSSPGGAMVYAASSLALAALEYLVHVDKEDAPSDLVALQIEVPDDLAVETRDAEALPEGWANDVPSPECAGVGDAWLAAGNTVVLRLPSALVPEEQNALINPAHPGAARIRVVSARPFSFDPRLLA